MLNLPELANPVASPDEAKSCLKPYYRTFKKCIDDGWQQLVEYPKRHTLDPRAQACFVNSAIVHNALAAFSGLEGVKPVKGGNTFFLYIGAEIKTRFKKLDRRGTYRNFPTDRQMMLLTQQRNIPGILPGTYLTLGWILDRLQQQIVRHLITLQVGKKVFYEIDIDEELAGMTPQVTPMRPAPAQDTTAKKRRVRPRQHPIEKPKSKGTSAGE